MSDIRITPSATGKRLLLTTPYNAGFVDDVKADLNGRWDADRRAWSVDVRDEERARTLLRDYFGTDGSPEDLADLVTIRVPVALYELGYRDGAKAVVAGRIIASRDGRDGPVRLGRGVVLVGGTFPGSGGSMKYPELNAGDTVVEVRDLPRGALDTLPEGGYEIVAEHTAPPEPEADQLRTRRAELLAQVAELDTALRALDPEGEALRADQAREQLTAEITARLREEHARDKADAVRALVEDQQARDRERDAEETRLREEEQRMREEIRLLPIGCRCGTHTCPPVAPTAAQYAQSVDRSTATVVNWCRTGKVEAVQHAGRWYVTAGR